MRMCNPKSDVVEIVDSDDFANGGSAPYTRSYMQMYAFALRTSSKVVKRTTVSLMYAHCRGALESLWSLPKSE